MKSFITNLFHSDELLYRALRTFIETFLSTFFLTITAQGFEFSQATIFAALTSAVSVAITAILNLVRNKEVA